MAQKHLHELLKEDQEPFHLKSYIADRRCQLKTSPETQIQLKKRKPLSASPSLTSNFRKNACFFSFHNSPEPTTSPLFRFASPAKRPNASFLHVPAKTASLLLEAATKIQKNSASKPKTQNRNVFGSIMRRLKQRGRTRKREIESRVSMKDVLSRDSLVTRRGCNKAEENLLKKGENNYSCEIWSESNEGNSFDMETSSSGSHSDDDLEFASAERGDAVFANDFGGSPFRFVLRKSPSPGRRNSYIRHISSRSPNETEGADGEEETEQCSPVSILEPPFQDDQDKHKGERADEEDEDFDMECSYEFVQRAKQQLLQKLHRFEKLAELDPIELERSMLEQGNCSGYDSEDGEEEEEYSSRASQISEQLDGRDQIFVEVLGQTGFLEKQKIPRGLKRLILDLIAEEGQEHEYIVDREGTVKRVCKRLRSWEDVEFNTIDMMVEQDIKKEQVGCKNHQNQVGETVFEVELAIFGLLVEEVTEELMRSRD